MLIIIETFMIAAVSGFLLNMIHFPLPWVLGPLVAVLTWKSAVKRAVSMPGVFRNGGLIIIGYMMGSPFTRETAIQIARHLPSILAVTLGAVLFSLLLAFLIYKPIGISLNSAILGSVPGGLTQMVILCDELKDADITFVTFMQSIRLLSVVFFVPFFVIHGLVEDPVIPAEAIAAASGNALLTFPAAKFLVLLAASVAGAWAAQKLKFPTPQMLGPLLIIALLQVAGADIPAMPKSLIILAQITIGIYIGLSFQASRKLGKATAITLLSTLALILLTFISAYYLAVFHDMNLATAFLSTAPGGISEMAVTALAIDADLSFVTAFQLFRLLFILFVVPPVLRLALSKADSQASA